MQFDMMGIIKRDNLFLKMKSLVLCNWITVLASFFVSMVYLTPPIWFTFLFVEVQREFNATAVQAGWLGSVLWSSSTVLSPLSAVLVEYLGIKPVVVLGSLLSSVSFFASSFAPTMTVLFLVFSFAYGLACCLIIHSTYSMFYNLFNEKNGLRALSLITVAPALGAFIGNGTIQRLFEVSGWRLTFRYLSAIMAGAVPFTTCFYRNGSSALAKPALVQIFPEQKQIPSQDWTENQNSFHCNDNQSFEPDEAVQTDSTDAKHAAADRLNNEDVNVTDDVMTGKNTCLKPADDVTSGKNEEKRPKHRKKLKEFLTQIDTWFLALCQFIIYSSSTIYYLNFVSFLETIDGISDYQVWLILSVTNISDVLTRLSFFMFGGKFCRPIYVTVFSVSLTACLSFLFAFVTSFGPLLVMSFVIGWCRSANGVMSFGMSVDILGSECIDFTVTMVMYCQGVGYLLGSLPIGIIYDVTGSYTMAFYGVAICFLFTAGILTILAVRSSRRAKTRKLTERVRSEERRPRVSLISYNLSNISEALDPPV